MRTKHHFSTRISPALLLVCLFVFSNSLSVKATSSAVFDYPQDGQTLDYYGTYLFRVQPMANASGYLWGFFQNGVLVWENLRDEQQLSSNEYGIYPYTLAHSKFIPGEVEVWVRGLIDGEFTDETKITIHFEPLSTETSRIYLPLIKRDTKVIVQVPVLVLAYFPPDLSNPLYLDPVETGWTNFLIADMQKATQGMIEAGQELISEATQYHGYKDADTSRYLGYYTYKKIEYMVPIPPGYHLDDIQRRPHYNQILRNINICDYVDTHGVKEVWIYSYHTSVSVPDESKMSSKYGDISNAYPKDEYIPAEFRLPRCINSYVMYNFTYQPGGAQAIGNTIHNRMHQIENVIFFAENMDYPVNGNNVTGSLFWDDFSVAWDRASLQGYRASCGNTHSPPNTTEGYDYDSLEYRENNCETWNPNDSLTTYVNQNCTQWGCTDIGFYKWFMQNMPGYNNGIVYNGKQIRNWWEPMYDFNKFIDAGRSLYMP